MVLLSLLENIILEHNFETTGGQIASHLPPYAPTSLTSLFSVERTVEPSTLTHQAQSPPKWQAITVWGIGDIFTFCKTE